MVAEFHQVLSDSHDAKLHIFACWPNLHVYLERLT